MSAVASEVDVVVIGTGFSGCVAALVAREAGLQVALLEKAPQVGGMTTQSSGLIWVGNHGVNQWEDTEADALAYLHYLGGGVENEEKLRTLATESPRAVSWLIAHGVPLRVVPRYPDIYYPVAPGSKIEGRVFECEPFPMDALGDWKGRVRPTAYVASQPRGGSYTDLLRWGGPSDPRSWDRTVLEERQSDGDRCGFGYGLIGATLARLLALGVGPVTESPAERLVLDSGGRVSGVEVGGPQATSVGARRAVVLATGGYGANDLLVENLEEAQEWSVTSGHETGDGIVMAGEVGGMVRRIAPNLHFMFGFPGAGGDETFRSAGHAQLNRPHSIIVNREAQRFADESSFQRVANEVARFDITAHRFLNRDCFLIFDAQYVERFGLDVVTGGLPNPAWLKRADNLMALGAQLGIDGDRLAGTATRFNGMVEAGVDLDFHRGESRWAQLRGAAGLANPNLGTVAVPPFYGMRLPGGGSSGSGVVTSVRGEVLGWRGRPIPGLYCVGVATARTEFGIGYQAGLDLATSATFAYLAVRHAAGLAS